MEKKIEDFLHLYPRAFVKTPNKNHGVHVCSIGEIHSIHYTHSDNQEVQVTYDHGSGFFRILVPIGQIKLLLRPLSDMTEEECEWINNEFGWGISGYLAEGIKAGTKYSINIHSSFEITRYLLSKSFDLFGLIDANLAIDKTKM